MTTLHDDLPHPVPPLAFLRWKENYFFIIIDHENKVFGVSHLNFEPGFNRARFSCNLSLEGQLFQYANEVPFPENFAFSRELSDGRLRLNIDESHGRFRLALDSEELDMDLTFTKRLATFDFNASKYAAPDIPSFKEVMTLGTNLPFEHLQQPMTVAGAVTVKTSNKQFRVGGYGYRDHTWCMRSDNLVKNHTWCGLNFPDRAFGVMTIELISRPDLIAKEGYVVDADGPRALKAIDVERSGTGPDGLPAKLIHRLVDVFDNEYVIESDVSNRLGVVPLVAEKPGGGIAYRIAENFCVSRLAGSDEPGYSIVELGVLG
ncbi:MAG: hypothetical protein WC997_07255 [Porticoccaceae bacterium]